MKKNPYWLQHVAISVADLDESIAWYQEMFGFTLVAQTYVPPCRYLVQRRF